jgi:hypothetical protein
MEQGSDAAKAGRKLLKNQELPIFQHLPADRNVLLGRVSFCWL